VTFLFKRNVTKMSREWVGLAVTNKKLFFTEKKWSATMDDCSAGSNTEQIIASVLTP